MKKFTDYGFIALLGLVSWNLSAIASSETSFVTAAPVVDASSILRFSEVVPGLYRGARPEYRGVQELAGMGIKTIINLENDRYAPGKEKKAADRLRLVTYASPMNAYRRPSDAQVDSILKMMQEKSAYPIFIHCHHGQDRTGLLVGLYRIEVQKWSPEAAYKEMLSIGFHPELKELDQYFRDRTGYSGP